MHETLQRLGLGRQRVGKETFYWWLDLFCIPVNAFKKGSWWAEASIVMFCLQWPEEMSQPGLCTMQWEIAVRHWGGASCGDDVAVYYNPINRIKKGKKKISQTSNLKGSLFQNCSDRVSMKWHTILWKGPWAWEEKHHYKQWFTPLTFVFASLLCSSEIQMRREGSCGWKRKKKKNLVEGGKKDILTPLCSAQKTMYLFGVPKSNCIASQYTSVFWS